VILKTIGILTKIDNKFIGKDEVQILIVGHKKEWMVTICPSKFLMM
jgi:hypothetical protein